jgi:hypothetical protein
MEAAAGLGHGDWTVGKCLAGEVHMGEGRCPVLRMGISAVSFRRKVSCAERAQRMWAEGAHMGMGRCPAREGARVG